MKRLQYSFGLVLLLFLLSSILTIFKVKSPLEIPFVDPSLSTILFLCILFTVTLLLIFFVIFLIIWLQNGKCTFSKTLAFVGLGILCVAGLVVSLSSLRLYLPQDAIKEILLGSMCAFFAFLSFRAAYRNHFAIQCTKELSRLQEALAEFIKNSGATQPEQKAAQSLARTGHIPQRQEAPVRMDIVRNLSPYYEKISYLKSNL